VVEARWRVLPAPPVTWTALGVEALNFAAAPTVSLSDCVPNSGDEERKIATFYVRSILNW
jgi:hypothetical protein